ncbi:MAG: sigma-70 family RNA polymerase sigma factor [Planctomycetota bacterium]|jgi:RNA polymerase sigma-70 factor (ECF subfamily)|nr:sigma-70 family RNA polymerase sigma factor [Planctomycetota bacterium]
MLVPLSALEFETSVRQTEAGVRAYIAGAGVLRDEVDDLAQEAYLEFYRNRAKIPEDVEPARWLRGIARNVCLNHIRRTARKGRLHREALAELLLGSAKDAPEQEDDLAPILNGCIEKLPGRSRRLVSMRYEDNLRSDAIAEVFESSAGAIRFALYKTRKILKACIDAALAETA